MLICLLVDVPILHESRNFFKNLMAQNWADYITFLRNLIVALVLGHFSLFFSQLCIEVSDAV